jgi:hypothetical protein
VPWLRWLINDLSLWRLGIVPRSVHVRFVAEEVALGQVSLGVLHFSLSISFHWGSIFIYNLRDEK